MKICYLTRDYVTESNYGGIATYIYNTAKYLVKHGNQVHVICEGNRTRYYKHENIHIHAIRPNYFWEKFPNIERGYIARKVPSLFYGWFFNFLAYKTLKKLHQKINFDIIESEDGAGIGLLPTYNKSMRVITRFHTPWTLADQLDNIKRNIIDSKANKYFERKQFLRSFRLNSDSCSLKKEINRIYNIPLNNIDVLYYGIDINKIINQSRKNNILKKKIKEKYILYFGRIEERKGIKTLAKAMPKIFGKYKNIDLLLVGNESYDKNHLKKYLVEKNKKYTNRINFMPRQSPEILFPIIAEAEIIILPSNWEAFGYTCLESMALGKIVIATSGSGFEEQIQRNGKNGYLFEPENHKELTKKILYVLKLSKKEKKKIEDNAKKRAKEFDNKHYTKKLLGYYTKIIKK